MNRLSFEVLGTPATKGSWRIRSRKGKAWLQPDNDKERPWADAVAWAAKQATGDYVFVGAVLVTVVFTFQRPKKPAHPWPVGDVDKLCRSLLDSMKQAGVYYDDNQVVAIDAHKVYGARPGASVVVTPMEVA